MTRFLAVFTLALVICGCVSKPPSHLSIDVVSSRDLQRFMGESRDTVVSALGPPSRELPARIGTYWEYRGGEQVIVFWSFDHESVLAVNIGRDEKEAYAPWESRSIPPLQATVMEMESSNKAVQASGAGAPQPDR